jgi:hypothetical protein
MNKGFAQGLGIIAFGVLFLILTSVLYHLGDVAGSRLVIFYGLSAFLIAIGVVAIVLSRRMQTPKPQKAKGKKANYSLNPKRLYYVINDSFGKVRSFNV